MAFCAVISGTGTKLEAERIVRRNPRHSAVRILLIAGASERGDRSFVEGLCRLAGAARDVTLYADEFRCPLPAGIIARALWERLTHDRPGLYTYGRAQELSRWEISQQLLEWYPELQGRLVRGSFRDHRRALRPADLSVTCERIQDQLSFPLQGLRDRLAGRTSRGADLWNYERSD